MNKKGNNFNLFILDKINRANKENNKTPLRSVIESEF